MFLTASHLVVHHPKTGGTWLREAAKEIAPGFKEVGAHLPVSEAPAGHGRAVVGMVRHPLPWYVSLYIHLHGPLRAGNQRHLVRAYGAGSEYFRPFLRGATQPQEGRVPPFPCLNKGTAGELIASGRGLCSWGHGWTYGELVDGRPSGIDIALRTSSLAQDAYERTGFDARHLPVVGQRKDTQPYTDMKRLGPDDYLAWYDDEMRGWVERADGDLATWIEEGAHIL